MKTLAHVIITTVLAIFMHNTFATQDETTQVQQLHEIISNDLIKISQKFPPSKRTVYSLLDRVCTIYKTSIEKIKTENTLKGLVKEKVTEIVTLKKENTQLKTELENIKNELNTTKETLNSTSQKLALNKTTIEDLKKEKEKIETEKMLLAQEKEKLIKLQTNMQQQNQKNQASAKNHLYPAHMKRHRYTAQNNHSLNLTSTSEPISPL
jgi:chromosome segregation ATPase